MGQSGPRERSLLDYRSPNVQRTVSRPRLIGGIVMILAPLLLTVPAIYFRLAQRPVVLVYVYAALPLTILYGVAGILIIPRPARRNMSVFAVVVALAGVAILIRCAVGVGMD